MAEPQQDRPGLLEAPEPEAPSFTRMIGIVAVGVALTILLFFGLGYGFGRLFM